MLLWMLPSLALCGCAGLGERIARPGTMGTQVSALRNLSEPDDVQMSFRGMSSPVAARTLAVPVRFVFKDRDMECMLMRLDWLCDSVGEARFAGGAIAERATRRIASANFHIVSGDERPVADFIVRMPVGSARESSSGVTSTIAINFEIVQADGTGKCYSRTFERSATEVWVDRSRVPASFYKALEGAINDFADDWGTGAFVPIVTGWWNDMMPQIKPPALRSIDWTQSGDVWIGRCEVACNGYEGFQARAWAVAQVASACRTKLGGIEAERVRVVYDEKEEKFDPAANVWHLCFRTFARTKIVLSFDKISRHGTVTGDLELLGMDAESASEKLKNFVRREMNSRDGPISDNRPSGNADVRFDNYVTDEMYNLITHTFRLL